MSIVWIWLQWRRGKVQLLQRLRCIFSSSDFLQSLYSALHVHWIWTWTVTCQHSSRSENADSEDMNNSENTQLGSFRAGICPQVPLISVCDLDCHTTCLYEVGQGTIMAGCLQKARNGARPPPRISPVFWTRCMNSVKSLSSLGLKFLSLSFFAALIFWLSENHSSFSILIDFTAKV